VRVASFDGGFGRIDGVKVEIERVAALTNRVRKTGPDRR
jgi:hypothetical protein